MFLIVKHKSSNAHDMRGIFIYLFLKSLTSEIDLYITLYTEQKSKHNRGNYSSMEKGCSPIPTKLIILFDKDVFFQVL